MNCVDAIEATVQCIIDRMYGLFFEGVQDDTEYIRNAKVVITGMDAFVQAHQEDVVHPELLQKRLYGYAKERWLNYVQSIAENSMDRDPAFYDYYFDYIYHHGIFPP